MLTKYTARLFLSTQFSSFSAQAADDPTRRGVPHGFTINVREARLAAGAGFVVASTGSIVTMPGLPRDPAAMRVHIRADGSITGLMAGDTD